VSAKDQNRNFVPVLTTAHAKVLATDPRKVSGILAMTPERVFETALVMVVCMTPATDCKEEFARRC